MTKLLIKKDGETMRVHPDIVEQCKSLGWQVVEETTSEGQPKPSAPEPKEETQKTSAEKPKPGKGK